MNDRLASLLPYPRSVRPRPGHLVMAAEPTVVTGPDAASRRTAEPVGRVLAAVPWPASRGACELTVSHDPGLAAEGYRLDIGQQRILVVAGSEAGAFYAAQTLRQLLPDAAWRAAPVPGPPWTLPCALIEDAPALAWRGAHLDVARHFYPKRDLLAFVDLLAAHKLNRLHLHLTDDQGWRIESRLHPELHLLGSHRPRTRLSVNGEQPARYEEVPHGGYYTLDDLAEIAGYAAQRMVTVVPEVEVPGHASALLAALPGLGSVPGGEYRVRPDWGIFPDLMSPLPATLDFLREVFGELLAAVPARQVHIGGDECVLDSWRASPAIEEYRRSLGLASAEALHAWFLRRVADVLAEEFDARAVVWDEGFASGELRQDTIVMAWRGMDIARRAAQAGHDVITVPVLPTYFDYSQSDGDSEPAAIGGPVRVADVTAFRPVGEDWPQPARARVLGTQFQVWTEYIRDRRHLEYMAFPRACALAEVAWSGGAADWTEGRLAAHLGRLDAAGVEYRPMDGPRPWQRGGHVPSGRQAGYRVADVMEHLGALAAPPE